MKCETRIWSRAAVLLVLLLLQTAVATQSAFDCTCQRIYYDHVNEVLSEIRINPGNNALQFPQLGPAQFSAPVAIGFRSTTGVVYILESGTNLLHRYYADGNLQTLPLPLDLPADMDFKAGEITPDGSRFYVVGSRLGQDRSLFMIDLESGDYEISEIGFSGILDIEDIAFDPYTDFMYLYNKVDRNILRMDLGSFDMQALSQIQDSREVQTLYFDAFGELFGVGTTQDGVASGLFRINKESGTESVWAAGPVAFIEDATGCPYTVKMQNEASAQIVFPCEEMEYSYTIANASGKAQSNTIFRAVLPPGFELNEIIHPTISGNDTYDPTTGEIEISSLVIPPGVHTIDVLVTIDENIEEGTYLNQGVIRGLPQTLGGNVSSDDPATVRENDPTPVTVTRVEDDSIYLTRFICAGERLELDGSIYGNSFSWSDGTQESSITVSEAGLYALRAQTGCTEVFVEFEVTVASCPFRLGMTHLPLPDSIFPCTEIIYEFVIDNATGVEQSGIQFTDTLPDGILFLDLIRNPFGGVLDESLLPGIVRINEMTIPVGIDTILFLVEVTDIDPGPYPNRARLDNLPVELGTFRYSDDPRTNGLDATNTHVLGVQGDSTYIEKVLCTGNQIRLDASTYGTSFEWENGSTEMMIEVDRPGTYAVKVFNGCEASWLFFEVVPGPPIAITFSSQAQAIQLGDTIRLQPTILNSLDSLSVIWGGGPDSSLSCRTCITTLASPLQTAYYQVLVDNGVCRDSAKIKVHVEAVRRYYAPNIFTPNGDGVNDYFSIYSPETGVLEQLEIFDRSGNVVFSSRQAVLNDPASGWDGMYGGQVAMAGVYFYNFRIRFADGFVRHFTGNVTLLR